MSPVMVQVASIILGIFVLNCYAVPSMEDRQDVYLETCQISCGSVSNVNEEETCREKFCPSYINYLFTGLPNLDFEPTLASTQEKEVLDFCATWIIRLIDQLGWRYRIKVKLDQCVCAAGKNCIVK